MPEEGGVYSRSISPGVATSSAEDSEYNAEIRGVELEGAEPAGKPKYSGTPCGSKSSERSGESPGYGEEARTPRCTSSGPNSGSLTVL